MTTLELTADVVRNTRFREKMRGYHPEEVHAFAERAATALEQLHAQLAEVTERALRAESALAANAENDGMIRRTLTLAEKTAELAVGEANDESERIRAGARAEAERLRIEADDECRQRVAEAEETRQAARAEGESLIAEANKQAEKLRRTAEEAIAARAEAAEVELEEVLTDLAAQRSTLQGHVDALTAYLDDERARVLDALSAAVESLGKNLEPSEPPNLVLSAMAATPLKLSTVVERIAAGSRPTEAGVASDDEPWASAEPATTTWSAIDAVDDELETKPDRDASVAQPPSGTTAAEPDDGDGERAALAGHTEGDLGPSEIDAGQNTSEGAETAGSVEVAEAVEEAEDAEISPPSTLLFTFDGDRRRPESDRRRANGDRAAGVAVSGKPRRTTRSRRPS